MAKQKKVQPLTAARRKQVRIPPPAEVSDPDLTKAIGVINRETTLAIGKKDGRVVFSHRYVDVDGGKLVGIVTADGRKVKYDPKDGHVYCDEKWAR